MRRYPLYIPSKGRHDSRLTMRALDNMGVYYRVIVEEQEYDDYAHVLPKEKLLILDPKYQDEYDCLDDLGKSKSKGPGPARNFAWAHSISEGYDHHWVMDDNIDTFYRFNYNRKIIIRDGAMFTAMEDFVLRYANIAMSGPNYDFFLPARKLVKPLIMNTRIYSCNLIRNDVPFRWRGRYNEDTDLSLRMLKKGWCTVQFNAFLQGKVNTQKVAGGNTEEFYAKEGTYPKSKMLVDTHPDVTRLVYKFGRAHHYVNYRPFQKNKLRRRSGVVIPDRINNYGLTLKKYPTS